MHGAGCHSRAPAVAAREFAQRHQKNALTVAAAAPGTKPQAARAVIATTAVVQSFMAGQVGPGGAGGVAKNMENVRLTFCTTLNNKIGPIISTTCPRWGHTPVLTPCPHPARTTMNHSSTEDVKDTVLDQVPLVRPVNQRPAWKGENLVAHPSSVARTARRPARYVDHVYRGEGGRAAAVVGHARGGRF